jgi:hypothetical protein
MTTISAQPGLDSRNFESLRHIVAVTRLHFVNKVAILYTPLIVLAAVFALNYAIWWLVIYAGHLSIAHSRTTTHLGYTGAVSYIFVYALVIAVQAVSRTFPFALGFGVTRRDFYLGSALAFVVLSIVMAAVLTVMSVIEIATSGWGVQGYMFAPVYFTNASWILRFLMYFFVFLFCLFIGSGAASMYVRWRAIGLTTFFVLLAVILVGGAAIVTFDDAWGAVAHWFAESGAFGVSAWTLVPTAIAGIAGFFILRRATPKN